MNSGHLLLNYTLSTNILNFALINDDYILYTCLFVSISTSIENIEGLLCEVMSRRKNENNLDSILVSPKLIILEETDFKKHNNHPWNFYPNGGINSIASTY